MFTAARINGRGQPLRYGPVHRLAGYTDAFRDFVTACGLTLPRFGAVTASSPLWIDPTRLIECGDCTIGGPIA